ncbi:hypothetical protein BDQ17DRAFT_1234041 [Cyathus striatus]|nr:hypothetical protein BDQ17DRAFT_1234041 [Cyathus striatus]
MVSEDIRIFSDWFCRKGGKIDASSIDITPFPAAEGGRGAVALQDIPSDHTLFTIPRSLLLSTRTSLLPHKFGLEPWKQQRLHKGWAGLILCMMWEEANGPSSKWSEYFATLPEKFDTPMFWDAVDLQELKGTSVVEKLGKEDAERDYAQILLPAVQSRPNLFRRDDIPRHYSLEKYHIMGSRILSRSFNLEPSDMEDDENDNIGNTSTDCAMDVDQDGRSDFPHLDHEESRPEEDVDAEEEEDEDDDDTSETAMVPMADMLNARYGSENAKLFYERDELRMVSTKPIRAGEQIWNTYGDLPNAELLRRYGHVDYLPIPGGALGNPGDVVEIRADLLVSVVNEKYPKNVQDRIDWWLDEGGDDTFDFEYDFAISPGFLSLVRLLLLHDDEWKKAKDKGKPPKPKVDVEVLKCISGVLQRRLQEYPTTPEDEEKMLQDVSISLNKKHAIIVRMGEKRILQGTLRVISEGFKKEDESSSKRKATESGGPDCKTKKTRR